MDIVDLIFKKASEKFPDDKSFADAINVKPQRVSEWKLRKSASYVKRLEIISKKLETTPQWLLTGEEHGSDQTDSLDRLAPSERQIILAYRRADDRARSMMDLALEPFKVPSQSDKAM